MKHLFKFCVVAFLELTNSIDTIDALNLRLTVSNIPFNTGNLFPS